MWVVGKAIKVQRNGRVVFLQSGDPVPEAAGWKHRKSWERSGHIVWRPDAPTPEPAGVEPERLSWDEAEAMPVDVVVEIKTKPKAKRKAKKK